MKVVMMLQNMAVGGIQRLVVDDANEMYSRGADVRVVYFEEAGGKTLLSELRIPQEHIVYIEYPRMRSLAGFLSLIRLLRKEKPDIVFAHHWFANTVARLAGVFAMVRVVVFEHSDYSAHYSRKQLLLDYILQFLAYRIVAVSLAVRDALVRRGINEKNLVVIPNGIVLECFASISHSSHEGFVFAFVGRLVADKCVANILRALTEVPETRLVVAGDGPEAPRLRAFADDLGVGNRIAWMGSSERIVDVLSRVDCLVLPSRREGFGLAVIEALASGIPVVVSEVANASRAVKDGINGFVVPVGDVCALSAAMARIATRTEEYERFAARAQSGTEQFSIQKHVDRLLALVQARA